jgi:hypothetical protein
VQDPVVRTSPSGHATIVIKVCILSPWRSGHAICSDISHTSCAYHLVFRALVAMVMANYLYKLASQFGFQFQDSVESNQNVDRVP